ncbi:reverse transcriptase [Gossypium australe]|uniref:Reverse transcriptase n=1 Tax=Gossypium australe TaxID=47621 RepID=A0A5B6WM06_9ROSI|nr:reverse transcriptase [Gossypium australe]
MMAFRLALEDCTLIDLGFKVRWFTWERGKFRSTNIRERLDRGVANLNWLELFPNAQIEHLTYSFSDHCLILLETMGVEKREYTFNPCSFQFEARRCLDSSFEDLVRGWWADSSGSIPDRLEDMGHKMHVWSRNSKREVQLDLNLEADKEELYWEQRARIAALEDDVGNRFSVNEDMIKIAQDYFETLFFASEEEANGHIFGVVEKRVTASMNESLKKQFTEEDICNAVKSMPPLKAPGIDGFVATFFQKYWHIVGQHISRYCIDILNGQKEIGDINKTRIVLIPKIDNPKYMSHFRSISFSNVIYKIIAKVLVNRISEILGDCINEAQGAFIPGRLISNNVLIAYEVLHSLKMKKRRRRGNFALKLDMCNDRVEWDFLAGMMKSLGFHDDWMVLIMRCVTLISYSVSLNGMSSDWFSPSRGLRQGDPLSPYLFLICAEGFSTLLEDAKQQGLMRGASVGREMFSINHLFFADNCILFGDATQEGVCTVRDIIREYEKSAGQKVNYDKSLIYFGANVKEEVKGDIINTLGVRVASNPEKYLGLPMMVGRRKAWAFASFKDRFWKHVDGWSFRYLSMGGKEVFIKSVLQATPLYAMQWFIFPKTLCSQLENIMNKFWWSNNKLKTGIHWSGWNKLYLSKFDGGLGFKNLFLFNKALLAKQVWRVLTQPQCLLARVLKARYFPFTDILAAKIGSYPSFTWRSICSARDLIEDGMLWSIGKGDRHDIRNRWITVNHLMQSDSATWNDELIRNLFYEDTANRIRSIPISGSSLEDTIMWKFEGSGSYSVRSGYQVWTCLQLHIQFFDESVCTKRSFARVFAAAENQQQCFIAISLWSLWFRLKPHLHDQWKAPKAGIVKINFDASFLSKDKIAIIAAVARNFKGSILGAETYLFENIADPFVAEARVCERALLFAKTLGFQRLEVEGDALSVIKSIKKKGTDTSVIRSITHHIYLMGSSFDQIAYLFTPRTANGAAHALTLEGRRTGYFGAWIHELPLSVISIARKEELQMNLDD